MFGVFIDEYCLVITENIISENIARRKMTQISGDA